MFPYSKEVVATYTYDAWGNCTITNKASANIGTINPFRYRGYYQDNELSQNCVSTKKHNKTAKEKLSQRKNLIRKFEQQK